jgi:hypothetical protein
MASNGQIDYEGFPANVMTMHRLNKSDDSPFLSPEHLKGFQDRNCAQCLISIHHRLFIEAKEAIGRGEKIGPILHVPTECYTDEWLVSSSVGYYPFIQSTCEGFSMSRFPVSDCDMKVHMQE